MTMKLIAFFLATLVVSSYGHLCLISPHQRGSMTGINKAAAADCVLIKGPCGQRPESASRIGIRAGSNFTVTWQKNLDHFYQSNPGQFQIQIGPSGKGNMTTLITVKDSTLPSLTLYSETVAMPASPGNHVLQAVYVTQNPKAPPAFFQCADIEILPQL